MPIRSTGGQQAEAAAQGAQPSAHFRPILWMENLHAIQALGTPAGDLPLAVRVPRARHATPPAAWTVLNTMAGGVDFFLTYAEPPLFR